MLAFTAESGWEPGIGDPTIGGWLTVLAYGASACICWSAARRAAMGRAAGLKWFWLFFAAGLLLLGVNKQLDLQTWLTLTAKDWFIEEGWYGQRRLVQAIFIGGVAVSGVAGLLGLRRMAGQLTRPVLIALGGGIFLFTFILIRASSFHHVDKMLGLSFGALKINWLLELGSILCIAIGAWRFRPAVGPDRPGRGVIAIQEG
jgi:hypothetical protein